MQPLRLTTVVPATDSPASLSRCVGAIEAALEAPDELVVVDRAAGPGPAAARNEGARRAGGDVLVFVDSDVVVHRDAFARIRRAFAADPGLDALFGSYDDTPGGPGVVSAFRDLLHHHVHQGASGPQTTFWAGLGAIRRSAFDAAGGFDAGRYAAPSIEDIELGMRLSRAGGRIEVDRALLGTHLKQWSLARMARTDLLARGVPWVALLLRERERSSTLNLSLRHRLSALAAVAAVGLALLRRPGRALAAVAAFVLLNRSFYLLLARRRGPLAAGAGVGLHLLHHLSGAAAVPLGALVYARERVAEPGASSGVSGARGPSPGRPRT